MRIDTANQQHPKTKYNKISQHNNTIAECISTEPRQNDITKQNRLNSKSNTLHRLIQEHHSLEGSVM